MRALKTLALRTYGKINLSLDVTGIRDDGYHEVAMVMQAIGLYDEMRIRILEADSDRITLKTDKYYVPTDERNTAYKAAKLMEENYLPASDGRREIRIDIKKNIPVSAGLAGGSSNAAGVIIALDRIFELNLSLEEMMKIGTKVGADVPFCISSIYDKMGIGTGASTCALAEGLGEILTPMPPLKAWVLLAKPPAGVSTGAVYKALDSLSGYRHPDTEAMIQAVKEGNLEMVSENLLNVLENVTMEQCPKVGVLKERMLRSAPGATLMSGSGPTVYSLFATREKAREALSAIQDLENERYGIYLVKTLA
ncbi:MAG: 4-(cytidine 5'-diphospho)-2-C-methyl-D-erythritol kinase [Clostridia bacterium]|nr:4-(cytidine 5'-diphospho)-2-C-methyl-D-erythritol kinase [Clostridia bacterium]